METDKDNKAPKRQKLKEVAKRGTKVASTTSTFQQDTLGKKQSFSQKKQQRKEGEKKKTKKIIISSKNNDIKNGNISNGWKWRCNQLEQRL